MTYFVGSQIASALGVRDRLGVPAVSARRHTLPAAGLDAPPSAESASIAREKAIIVGAGDGGEQISRALVEDPSSGYEPIGFIDESPERWGSRIHGIKVLGGTAELPLALSANGVGLCSCASSDVTAATAGEVADICTAAGVDCRMLPALSELLHADGSTNERPGLQRVWRSVVVGRRSGQDRRLAIVLAAVRGLSPAMRCCWATDPAWVVQRSEQ